MTAPRSTGDDFAPLRAARLRAMWARYCELADAAGMPYCKPKGVAGICSALCHAYRVDKLPPGWWFASSLEAADIGGEDYDPRQPQQPCPHRAGTAGRVATLAERAARGEELWCEEDFR